VADPVEYTARTWIEPDEANRRTWTDLRSDLRRMPGLEDDLSVPDGVLDDIIAGALTAVADQVEQREQVQFLLGDTPPESLLLPWRPHGIVRVSWRLTAVDGSEWDLPEGLYAVSGTRLRWLGGESCWPGNGDESVTIVVDMLGRPQTMQEEPDYQTVATHYLWPLLELEALLVVMRLERRPPSEILDVAMLRRPQILATLPRQPKAARLPQGVWSADTNPALLTWGDTDHTFADLFPAS
jgi:hypothetical protein